MSDDLLGTCCSFSLTLCCNVLAGICVDFTSIRHSCTEHLFSCSCGSSSEKDELEDGEREPLIGNGGVVVEGRQPNPQPYMTTSGQ
ncbi:hypothetical protein JAAARDRAFT_258682 [Jaapia argillacea MUCL 33604]|uniref:CxC6 like cysteine cluster associated with KDZ domain-containing protein n=1 Tax=Jaapia argillacea MUCL 33604 TaxID=933084 RepID=A0A067PWA0_9AGAM|nr:hypothetical protein JAAARDRAFT_258682 [Jaapia argillacea MUCL 33604]